MTAATYNGDGLRASTTTSAGGTRHYTWDTEGNSQQLLMDDTNAYIYADGTAPAEQVNLATGAVTYLVTDSLGSVRGTVSSTGALTGSVTYDAWGNPLTTGGLTATTPFGYAGSYADTTGLDYLINRYYDSAAGQFLSIDPEVAQTLAAYAYADGNPVLNTDPTGLAVHETWCYGGTKYPNQGAWTSGWPVRVCVMTTDSTGITKHGYWRATVSFSPESGRIGEIGARQLVLDACGETNSEPTRTPSCPAEDSKDPTASKYLSCPRGSGCTEVYPQSLSTAAYGSGARPGGPRWNWVHSYVVGAWAKSATGNHKSNPVSVAGDGWTRTCTPGWKNAECNV
jgi:RHS repeat-associated protein